LPRIHLLRAEPRRQGRRIVESVEEAIPRAAVLGTFGSDEIAALRGVESAAGGYWAWGLRDAEPARSAWSAAEPGDWVIGFREGRFALAARILERRRKSAFAERVWGADPDGAVRELLLFLSRPEPLPAGAAEALAAPPGEAEAELAELGGRWRSALEAAFGSLERFVAALAREEQPPASGSELPAVPEAAVAQEPGAEVEPAAAASPPPAPAPAGDDSADRGEALRPPAEPAARPEKRAAPPKRVPPLRRPSWLPRSPSRQPGAGVPVEAVDAILGPRPQPPEGGHPAAGGEPPGLETRLARGLSLTRSVAMSSVSLLLLAAVVLEVARGAVSPPLLIEPIPAPRDLVEAGFRPPVLGRRLADRVRAVLAAVDLPEAHGYSPALRIDDVEVAETSGLPLRAGLRALGELLGALPARVRGEVVRSGDRLEMRLRLGDAAPVEAGVAAGEGIEALLEAAANRLIEVGDPFLVALHLADSQPAEALAAVHLALARPPAGDDAFAHVLEARLLRQSGDAAGAVAALERAAALSPDLPAAHRERARLLAERKDHAGAAASWGAAAALDPEDARVQLEWGRALEAGGDLEGALARYRRAAEIDPASAKVRTAWAGVLVAQGDTKGAEALYREATALAPGDPAPWNDWANALQRAGDIDGALEKLARATQIDPRYAVAYNNRGVALRSRNDHQGAIAMYRKAVEIDPGYAVAYNNWGVALRALKDENGAVEKFRRATEIAPDYASPWNNWGLSLQALGDHRAAVERFRRAAELAPGEAGVHYNWGLALMTVGDHRGALERYQQALDLDPQRFAFVAERIARLRGDGPSESVGRR
jgi:tetratricopeptide (TPR) repeat protein